MPVTKAGEEMPKTPDMAAPRSSPASRPERGHDAQEDADDEHDDRADQPERGGDTGPLPDQSRRRCGCR